MNKALMYNSHCPWVDNCIGVNNHRHFVLYVLTLAAGILFWDLLIYKYLSLIPQSTDSTSCTILSESLCSTLNSDPFTFALTVWATLQLVWVSMLLVVQLVQVARGLTTFEAMSGHKHMHGHKHGHGASAAADALTSFVASGDPNLANAGLTSANRGPDPAVPAHPHKHKGHIGSYFSNLSHMLGVDTFLATAMFGSRAKEVQAQNRSNPFSRGLFGNCSDFWCDKEPVFRSRENGAAMLGGNRVDYTRMYNVPAARRRGGGRMEYEAVATADEDV